VSFDFLNRSDYVNNVASLDLLRKSIKESISFDAYGKRDIFPALVLIPPKAMTVTEAASHGAPTKRAVSQQAKGTNYIFKVRILGKNSPHQYLPDPTDPSFNINPDESTCSPLTIVNLHTTVVMIHQGGFGTPASPPAAGDIVEIRLQRNGAGGALNMQIGEYVKKVAGQGTGGSNFDQSGTYSVVGNFDYLDEYMPVKALTATYTDPGATPIKITNGSLLKEGIIESAKKGSKQYRPKILKNLTQDYDNLAMAFANANGGKQLGAYGYRPLAVQISLSKDPEKAGLAAEPGTSNHGWGTAIDLHYYSSATSSTQIKLEFNSPEYKWLLKNAHKHGWENPSWALQGRGREEPWHWESTKMNRFINLGGNTRPPPGASSRPPPAPETPPVAEYTSAEEDLMAGYDADDVYTSAEEDLMAFSDEY